MKIVFSKNDIISKLKTDLGLTLFTIGLVRKVTVTKVFCFYKSLPDHESALGDHFCQILTGRRALPFFFSELKILSKTPLFHV